MNTVIDVAVADGHFKTLAKALACGRVPQRTMAFGAAVAGRCAPVSGPAPGPRT